MSPRPTDNDAAARARMPPESRNVFVRAVAVARREGWRIFALKLAAELGYRRLLLLERALDASLPEPAASPRFRFGLLSAARVGDFLAFRPNAARDVVLARLDAGWLCFVAWHDDAIVASCWSKPHRADIAWVDYEFGLAADEVYLFDAYTQDAWRGQGIAHALCLHQLRHLRDAGYRRAIRGTVPENRSALRAHAKSGFRPVAMVTRIRIGPWRRVIRASWTA